ncbi:MAG: DUF11 domain-containing protein [Porticoccaceae bacterium]
MTTVNPNSRISTSRALARLVLFVLVFMVVPVQAALFDQTITINGTFGDWTSPNNVLTNDNQISTDEEGNNATGSAADLDYIVASTGRDLKDFAYTWDSNNLYFYVSRYGSSNNTNLWWFYLDTDADGFMETGEKVFSVAWNGQNRKTEANLYDYTADSAGGDSLVCLSSCVAGGLGLADGYTMPGTISNLTNIYGSPSSPVTGGSADGIQMEASMPWSVIGFLDGPAPLGFHISSSNSTNIPNQIDDNMTGVNSNTMFFVETDLSVTKTAVDAVDEATAVTQAVGGSQFKYIITVENTNTTDAVDGVSIDDALPAGMTFVSAAPSQGTYDPTVNNTWDIGTLAAGATATLTITVTVDNPPNAGTPGDSIEVTNTADNLDLLALDTVSGNNQASVLVTLWPAPDLNITKTSVVIDDYLSGPAGVEFHIPGALVEYTVVLENTSTFAVADSVVIEDLLPPETTYVPETLTLNTVDQTDDVDGDAGAVAADTVTVNLGTIAVESTTTVTFQVKIN